MRQFILWVLISIFFFSCHSAQQITGLQKNWYELLPVCPCKNPDLDSIRLNDGWARETRREEMTRFRKMMIGKNDFTLFHPGATVSFRSYPFVITYINGKKYHSGQQCTYDAKGNLIKSGPAAGTPDKVSPAKGEKKNGTLRVTVFRVFAHLKRDAKPWKKMGWESYNKLWPPDQGKNCLDQ